MEDQADGRTLMVVTSMAGDKFLGYINSQEDIIRERREIHLYEVRLVFERMEKLTDREGNSGIVRNLTLMAIDANASPLEHTEITYATIYKPDAKSLPHWQTMIDRAKETEMATLAMESGLHLPGAPNIMGRQQ